MIPFSVAEHTNRFFSRRREGLAKDELIISIQLKKNEQKQL